MIRTMGRMLAPCGITLLLLAGVFMAHGVVRAQDANRTFTGWAWSDTIGWISLSGPGYAVSVAHNGDVSGYAWSEHIGWVSAQPADLVGCPRNPCRARLDGNRLTGWMKALAGGSAQSGGWDGWISLSGTNPTYGPAIDPSTGKFSGFAWGSDVVGWVDFSLVQVEDRCPQADSYSCQGTSVIYTDSQCRPRIVEICEPPLMCSPGVSGCTAVPVPQVSISSSGHLKAVPSLVRAGDTTALHWTVQNAARCTVTGSNGDRWTGLSSGASGRTSSPIRSQTIYTLSCSALPGATPSAVEERATVNVIPQFKEE